MFPEFEMVPVRALKIDHGYQRLPEPRFRKIAAEWDPHLFGTLVVSRRGRRFYVIDGQHRLEAARLRGDVTEVPCLVLRDLDPKGEAEVFIKLQNERKALSAMDRFKAELFREEPRALAVRDAAEEYGFRIQATGRGRTGQHVGAVVALEDVYRKGGEDLLRRTFRAAKEVGWQNEDKPVHGSLFTGLGYFLSAYEAKVDMELFQGKVREYPTARLAAMAADVQKTRGSMGGGSGRTAYVVEMFATVYNRAQRRRALRIDLGTVVALITEEAA